LLAAGIGESDILIWDAASGKEQYSLSSHADKWEKWSYRLLSGNPIFPADTQTGRPGKVVGLVYSPDGAHLASIDTQVGIARVWEMPGGGLLHDELGGYFKAYQSAVFSPDGGRLATVSLGNVTEVWDVANGKGIWSMPASVPEGLYTTGTRRLWYHQRLLGASEDAGKSQSAAFSPDGKFLAAALPEGTLRVWDANSGTEAFSFSGPRFIGAYFTPDGGHLVGFSADGKFRVFTLRLEELVELARSRLTRGWRPEECQKYLHLEACPTTP
jgi:WD40 repeat protein